MHYDEFVKKVQILAEVESFGDTERLVEVVLATFGERLSGTEIAELGAQLPIQIKKYLIEKRDVDLFPLYEFYNRVCERLDTGLLKAKQIINAVMVTLKDAITPGVLRQLLSTLPADYKELFYQNQPGQD
jgi:uncharacterized protein (DUF2267 family)